jgi:hypothetical protein
MRPYFIIPAIVLTAACQVDRAPGDDNITVADMPEGNQTASAGDVIPVAPPSPTTNQDGAPQPADAATPPPPHLDPDAPPLPAEKSALGAARRVLEYCAALATGRYGDAFRLWGDGGKASGLTEAQFRDKYHGVRITDCVIGTPDDMQGAAGSIYIEVPNRFRGTGRNGRPLSIDGPVVLRRVNDVDGSTPEQRRWHIARAEFPPER